MVLSLMLTSFVPSAGYAAANTTAVAAQAGAEDIEAARQRLMSYYNNLQYEADMMARVFEEGLENSPGISEDNAYYLRRQLKEKANELKNLSDDEQLKADMQQIIDNSGDDYSYDEIRSRLDDLRYQVSMLGERIQSASSMEELAMLESEMQNLMSMTDELEMVIDDWLHYSVYSDNAFNITNVSRYYETIWNYATELNHPIFHNDDLFMAKGIIFKVLDEEKKTCQAGSGNDEAILGPSYSECWDEENSTLILPDQVYGFTLTTLGNYAFQEGNLYAITLNESLEEIGYRALHNWYLKEIILPRNVKTVCKWAFYPSRIEKFEVDAQNTNFRTTPDMKGVIETATKTLVAAGQYVEIPQDVEALGDGVFHWCRVETIELPVGLKRIGKEAFYNSDIKRINLPEGLLTIDDYAFAHCYDIAEIHLPAAMISMGTSAFYDCSSLLTIRADMQQPLEIPEDVFRLSWNENSIYDNAALYVPKGLREVYAATPGWSKFKKILEEGEIDLDPFEGYEQQTDPEEVKDVEDLSGVVVNDIYYSMDTENGDGYDESTNSLVFNSTLPDTNEDELDNTPALPDDFYGICFQVPAGSGRVTIDVETVGSRTLGVKVGTQPAKHYAPNERQQIVVEYTVYSPTYIYVYPSNKPASARRNAASANDDCMKLYGIKWEKLSEPSGIRQLDANSNDEHYYNLNGQRTTSTSKGVYIVKGRKVVR